MNHDLHILPVSSSAPVYVLKHRDTPLIWFAAEHRAGTISLEIREINRDALHLMPIGMEVGEDGLRKWLVRRVMSRKRANFHAMAAESGISSNRLFEFIRLGRGLSLSDCHWVDEENSQNTFSEVNLYDNGFSRFMGEVALSGKSDRAAVNLASSPEYTTHGILAKCWQRREGKVMLCKAGSWSDAGLGLEPFSEYLACQIAEVLGVAAVGYGLAKCGSLICSTCGLFTNMDVSFVPASQLAKTGGMSEVLGICRELGPEFTAAIEDMIVFDALIANTDRHFGNFGFLVDGATNRIIAPAPVFDHGNSLFSRAGNLAEDPAKLQAYADKLRPCAYGSFFAEGRGAVRERHIQGLRRLLTFEFARHSRYNMPAGRMKAIARQVNQRAVELLKIREDDARTLVF